MGSERAIDSTSGNTVENAPGTVGITATPQSSPPTDSGKVERSYTRTEILAGVIGKDPLAVLSAAAGDGKAPFLNTSAATILIPETEGVTVVEVPLAPGADPLAAVAALSGAKGIAWAEPNEIVSDAREWTPNDPSYFDAGQYFLRKSQTDQAWDTTKGNPAITVGIADDGLAYNHPDLADNVWVNAGEVPFDGTDNDGNGYVDDVRGWDFNQNDNNPLPAGSDTHGTHVAGIVGARSNNLTGVAGTAGGDAESPDPSGVRIVPLRWYGTNNWTASIIASTYRYAADNKLNIVNASYNFDGWVTNGTPNATVDTALNYAYDRGVLLINSAGNDGTLGSPRSVFTQPLFVASLDSNDVRSGFSNYGDFVDVSGSGSNILSTTTANGGTDATYGSMSGTSMSTPHAAGVAALIWSAHPTWTRDQVAAQLLGTADSVNAISGNVAGTLGTGRVNALRGVTETLVPPVFTNLVANAPSGNPDGLESVTVTVPRRLDPASVVAANFELRSDGSDNTFDTADDEIIPLSLNGGAAYRMGTNALTFTRSGGAALSTDRYRLTGFSGAGKLRDPFGTALDGNDDGQAGGDYVQVIGANPSISGTVFEDWNGNGVRDPNDPGTTAQRVFIDTNGNGVFDGGEFSNSTPLNIPDNNTKVYSDIVVSGVGVVTDVDVTVNITHPFDSDLDVFLVSPTGTRVELFTDVGGSGQNFTQTILDDEASLPITSGSAPFTGRFRPEGSLSAVDGLSADGTWQLELADDATQDVGSLQSWSLRLNNLPSEPAAVVNANGNYSFKGLSPGEYTLFPVPPAGWISTGPTTGQKVTVPAAGTATGVNLGLAKNNRFYARVLDDRNADGQFAASEPGIPGRTVYLDTNGSGSFDPGSVYSFTNSTPLNIPDTNTKVFSAISATGQTGTVVDLEVKLNITHTYVGDLNVFLIGPNGARVELFTRVGGSGDDFINTVLDDQAAIPVTDGIAPFTGTYRPEGLLSALNGIDPNGTWQLELADAASADTGTLNNWTLTVTTAKPEPSAVTNAGGNAFLDLPAGSQTVGLGPANGWKFTAPADGRIAVTASGAPLTDRNFGVAENVPPTVSTVRVDSGAVQRSVVKTLTVTFSERVQFAGTAAAAFAVAKVGGGNASLSAVVDDSGPGTVVTLSFTSGTESGSLADGKYSLTVLASQVRDVAQNGMAADHSTPFHRLFGDGNGDASVTGEDFELFGATFGIPVGQSGYNAAFDGNGDGAITGEDYELFGQRFGISL